MFLIPNHKSQIQFKNLHLVKELVKVLSILFVMLDTTCEIFLHLDSTMLLSAAHL